MGLWVERRWDASDVLGGFDGMIRSANVWFSYDERLGSVVSICLNESYKRVLS